MPFKDLLVQKSGALTFISYRAAEAYTQQLGAQLLVRFDLEYLKQSQYVAIPRGGHIVLGMLSYLLDLPHEALANPNPDLSRPLVVVDDCAISGHRFGGILKQHPDSQIIFAHLCSVPALREAILSAEPNVIDCVAAYDLKDLTEERFPDPKIREDWQLRWGDQATAPRYWVGIAELVIFPWNEPDRPYWNPETNQVEDNWRLASPDRCLKNWGKLGVPPRLDTKAAVRIPDQVAYTVERENVTLCNLADEMVYGLDGVAADIWRGLAAYGDLSATRDYILTLYDVEAERLTADIQSLVNTLLSKGLLEPVDDLSPT